MEDASKTVLDLLKQLADNQERIGSELNNTNNSHREPPVEPPVMEKTREPDRSTQRAYNNLSQFNAVQTPISEKPIENPSTIIKYTHALRYIVKYVTPNEFIMKEIKLMIQDQERREHDWFARRQELIRKINNRGQNRKELENVFKLIGVQQGEMDGATTGQDAARELQSYDLKVYQDQQRLIQEQTQQLRDLKIPLFCSPKDNRQEENVRTDQRKILQFFKDMLCD